MSRSWPATPSPAVVSPRQQGDLAGARERYERALRIFQHFLGDDHPNTQIVRENLESLDT